MKSRSRACFLTLLLVLCVLLFRPAFAAEPLDIPREAIQAMAMAGVALLYTFQRLRAGTWHLPGRWRGAQK